MDKHQRIAANLHLLSGITYLCILVFFLFGLNLMSRFESNDWSSSILWWVMRAILVFLALACVLQIVVAALFLNGNAKARSWLIILSVIEAFIIPVGPVIASYSLWAFFRPGLRLNSSEPDRVSAPN
jgi:small-conductance mechanosensitive channel